MSKFKKGDLVVDLCKASEYYNKILKIYSDNEDGSYQCMANDSINPFSRTKNELRLIISMNKTLETLEVGDIVVEGATFQKILTVQGEGELRVYGLSDVSTDLTSDKLKKYNGSYTAFELKEDEYNIYQPSELTEDVEEITMPQLCKELGREVKIKK